MAVDATGTPTSPDNIPTYNTAADAPSGKGLNNIVAAIQTALSARVSKPSGIVTGEAAVWNGTGWDRSTVTRIGASSLGSGTPTYGKVLHGDGTWDFAASYALTLPASPVDGQEAVLVDSLTAPTYQWRFRYNAGSASTFKWEFVGGAPAYAAVETSETTASGTAVDLATVGPTITVPRAGDYLLRWSGSSLHTVTGNNTVIALARNGVEITRTVAYHTANFEQVHSAILKLTGLSASDIFKLMYLTSAATATFMRRRLEIVPVRVS